MFSILAGAETEQVARASVLALWVNHNVLESTLRRKFGITSVRCKLSTRLPIMRRILLAKEFCLPSPGSDRKRTDANLTCASNFSMTSGAQVTSGSVKSGGKGHQFNGRRSSRNASLASEVIVQLTMPTTEGVTRRPAV
ncbi:hypothetical protein U1Q18_044848 [Sarracenia purpurea var. burkii]